MPDVPHDETVGLRLELHREKSRADAFAAALNKHVLELIRDAASRASANDENYSLLYDENQELEETIHQQAEEINRLTEEVEKLKADGGHPPRTSKAVRPGNRRRIG